MSHRLFTIPALVATIVASMAVAGPIQAQSQVESETTNTSGSFSTVNVEGSTTDNTPGISSSTGNNTAPCVRAYSAGLGQPGLGLMFSVPTTDITCATMEEAKFLTKLVDVRKRNYEQFKVAVTHSCKHSRKLRSTMVAVGWCKAGSQAEVWTSTRSVASRNQSDTAGQFQRTNDR